MADAAASYASQWRDLKRRKRLVWAAYFLMCAAITVWGVTEQPYWLLALFLFFFLGVAAGANLASFLCPRCRKPFAERNFFWVIFWTRKCLNCGLRRDVLPEGSQ